MTPMSVALFRNIPLFENLADTDLELLVRHAHKKTYRRNAILINEGDRTDSMYVIESGKVKVYLSNEDGKEVILSMEGPGSYIGEIALLDDEPRSASVVTLERSVFQIITKDDFRACLAGNPDLALSVIRTLTLRLRSVTEKIRNLALRNVYGRVVNTLTHLTEERDGRQVVTEKLTQQDIADMIGASREMVSRILHDLVAGGYLTIENRQITILKTPPSGW